MVLMHCSLAPGRENALHQLLLQSLELLKLQILKDSGLRVDTHPGTRT